MELHINCSECGFKGLVEFGGNDTEANIDFYKCPWCGEEGMVDWWKSK